MLSVHDEVMKIRNLARELSGVKNIALMAVLESTSAAFIPYLADLAKRLGCNDLTYTDVHGEADIEHANQFLEALSDEKILGYQNPDKDIDDTITLTLNLLKKFFHKKIILYIFPTLSRANEGTSRTTSTKVRSYNLLNQRKSF
jgi:heme oxygenase-like protein